MNKLKLKEIKTLLPKRSPRDNKTDYGHVLIIGGSEKYLGAAILSSLAATKSGAGYTHIMSDAKKYPWLDFPDFILHKMNLKELKNKNNFSVGIGPGLGTGRIPISILNYLIKNKFKNVVVDADALTIIANKKIKKLPNSWILTPHEGELARLLGVDSKEVKKNRLKYAKIAQRKFGCNLILKGAVTLLVSNTNKVVSVSEGQRCLAKAGSGDVLTGIIAAMLAQDLTPFNAMKLSCFIHGLASKNFMKKGNDELSMRPLDLINEIPSTIRKIR